MQLPHTSGGSAADGHWLRSTLRQSAAQVTTPPAQVCPATSPPSHTSPHSPSITSLPHSRVPLESQPSQSTVLPSSHSSSQSTMPLPTRSTVQRAEQPSQSAALPSSHSSPGSRTPSPQGSDGGGVQEPDVNEPQALQSRKEPPGDVQVTSPSHTSPGSTTPSPHRPGEGRVVVVVEALAIVVVVVVVAPPVSRVSGAPADAHAVADDLAAQRHPVGDPHRGLGRAHEGADRCLAVESHEPAGDEDLHLVHRDTGPGLEGGVVAAGERPVDVQCRGAGEVDGGVAREAEAAEGVGAVQEEHARAATASLDEDVGVGPWGQGERGAARHDDARRERVALGERIGEGARCRRGGEGPGEGPGLPTARARRRACSSRGCRDTRPRRPRRTVGAARVESGAVNERGDVNAPSRTPTSPASICDWLMVMLSRARRT